MTSDDIFATSPQAHARLDYLAGQIPVLLVDNLFSDPHRVRETALGLPFEPAGAHYPGRRARMPSGDQGLTQFLAKVAALVTQRYLPQLPPFPDGRKPSTVRAADTDFAVTDVRPDDLTSEQSRPHVDHVPIFGLVYLNEVDRGGTLFFRPRSQTAPSASPPGYQVESDEHVELCGKIEGRFNRLAIYPGFILHSGEVKGDWINSDERITAPRLTQRIMFFF